MSSALRRIVATRKARLGLAAAAVLVLLGAVAVLGASPLVHYLVISRLEAATGRPASAAEVDFSLFTRDLLIRDLQVAGARGTAPLLSIARLDAELHLLPILRGRLHVADGSVQQPTVRITRTGPGRSSIDDVVDHIRRRPEGDPALFFLDAVTITEGSIVLVDAALSPTQTWALSDLTAELDDVGTLEGSDGSARGSASLAGAAVAFEATDVHLATPRARAKLTVDGFDIRQMDAYIPDGAGVDLARGLLSAGSTLAYADGRLTLSGTTTIDDIELRQAALAISARLSMVAHDIALQDGRVTAGRLEGTLAATIVDHGVTPATRFEVRSLEVIAGSIGYPGSTPAQVRAVAELAPGGRIESHGTVELDPIAVRARATATGIAIDQLAPYVPAASPVTIRSGEFDSEATVTYSPEPGLTVDATFAVLRPVIGRRGQREPLLTAPRLEGSVNDLVAGDGGVGVSRLHVRGAPTVVDAMTAPSSRFEFTALSVDIRDADAAGRTPARVAASAKLAGGGRADVTGTFQRNPGILHLRAALRDVALSRAQAYLQALPVAVDGRADASLDIAHRAGQALRVTGDATVTDFVLARADGGEPLVVDPSLQVEVTDLALRDDGGAVERVTIAATPAFSVPATQATQTVALDGLDVTVTDVQWPGDHAARLTVQADLPQNGTLSAHGAFSPARQRLEASVEIFDGALGPFAVLLPIQAPVGGRLDAALSVDASFDEAVAVSVAGNLAAHAVQLGEGEAPPVSVAEIRAEELRLHWPRRLEIERLVLVEPHVTIEREADREFPLREMLRPVRAEAAAPPAVPAAGEAQDGGIEVAVAELRVENGYARFIDRTTTPSYSEEVSNLTATVRGLDTATDAPASVSLYAVAGADAALQLRGEMAPFGDPFSLDLAGELEGFSVPRTNPYARRFLDWIARRGSLTTKVRYRIVGDELHATNDILVERLDVEPADGRADGEVDERLGMPLGLIVALLKNPSGDIRLNVPITGTLSDPKFDFGQAIASALRNTVGRLVTAPFRFLGKVFGGADAVEEVAVDPVVFAAGSSVLTPEADRQVQRVADFLRASPYVGFVLQPIVTSADLQLLGRQEVAAQVQRLQRERGLQDFSTAAATLFRERHPDRPLPAGDAAILDALSDSPPPGASQQLAQRRVAATRQALIERAGIEPERLRIGATVVRRQGEGSGRLEFALMPVEELAPAAGVTAR